MRLEIEDNKGFMWTLKLGYDVDPQYWNEYLLLYHSHNYTTLDHDGRDPNEHLCLHYYNRGDPNLPIDQRDWTCGGCNHKVPHEIVEYYDYVKWGLETRMFEEEIA